MLDDQIKMVVASPHCGPELAKMLRQISTTISVMAESVAGSAADATASDTSGPIEERALKALIEERAAEDTPTATLPSRSDRIIACLTRAKDEILQARELAGEINDAYAGTRNNLECDTFDLLRKLSNMQLGLQMKGSGACRTQVDA